MAIHLLLCSRLLTLLRIGLSMISASIYLCVLKYANESYLGDVTIDLSQVMFIATANSLDTISPPLLDRCEIIECSGYVTDEKLAIAKKFLLPRQIKECGLEEGKVVMQDEALLRVILDYTGEVCSHVPSWLTVGWGSIT
jgi:hypothetical protein